VGVASVGALSVGLPSVGPVLVDPVSLGLPAAGSLSVAAVVPGAAEVAGVTGAVPVSVSGACVAAWVGAWVGGAAAPVTPAAGASPTGAGTLSTGAPSAKKTVTASPATRVRPTGSSCVTRPGATSGALCGCRSTLNPSAVSWSATASTGRPT
jgi:hypothetical protein